MFDINSKEVRSSLSIAKLVKPISNDYFIDIRDDCLMFSSVGKRHIVVSKTSIPATGAVHDYLLPIDRASILDVDAHSCKLGINEKSISFKYVSSHGSKNASVKRRSDSVKRPAIPNLPEFNGTNRMKSTEFDFILRQLSASAQVKNTKTEEDMRINQVVFRGSDHLAISNARYYATVVRSDLIDFDMNIVSSDIPLIRAFLEHFDVVEFTRSADSVYFMANDRKTWLKVANHKHDSVQSGVLDVNNPSVSFKVSKDSFKELMRWGNVTIEGSQRVTLRLADDILICENNGFELGTCHVKDVVSEFKADFPLAVLTVVSEYLSDGEILVNFSYPKVPDILTLTQSHANIISTHYIRSMKPR